VYIIFERYLRNSYRQPYIYIVFTTGWHFMPNILPRAVIILILIGQLRMKTSSLLECENPDVFWLRVHFRVKVEFAVYSLSFELMFMNDPI
jgi:hypothetical protein